MGDRRGPAPVQKLSAEESQKILLELLNLPENSKCADCHSKGINLLIKIRSSKVNEIKRTTLGFCESRFICLYQMFWYPQKYRSTYYSS